MQRLPTLIVGLGLTLLEGCESEHTTPCQRLVRELATHGQAAMAAGSRSDSAALAKALAGASASAWNVPLGEPALTDTRERYERRLKIARSAVMAKDGNRQLRVDAAAATVFALYDVAVVCAGER